MAAQAPVSTTDTMPLVNNETVRRIIEVVVERGRARAQAQGKDFNEIDFLCGAMSVFFALNVQHKIPAMWVLGPMTGREHILR